MHHGIHPSASGEMASSQHAMINGTSRSKSYLFLSQFDKRGDCLSVEYGATWWLHGDNEDVNEAMIEEASAYIPALLGQASGKAKETDLAEAQRLAAKHDFKIQQG